MVTVFFYNFLSFARGRKNALGPLGGPFWALFGKLRWISLIAKQSLIKAMFSINEIINVKNTKCNKILSV
jgi:hypothetical protein